ncbi:response regulator transcription factor [Williamsia phyllosphaerae]|uniref:DNA-binding response regulator n=1 Tax=Williamsia phyllosphaerae TaxID=885042 RepID=A0ABQ1UTI9_9NOCA|nr:response regulator transcription factor [Williamsia phyllosphaerae]GGF24734.1 DNA-binding response regulator [Williamsia phyllosphaerae]
MLVVDDEPLIRESIAERFRAEGFDVTTADTGPAAVAIHRKGGCDVVILDLMLPGMDGLEVCRRMQAHSPTPVLMLTARSAETDLVIGLGVGADDYLSKPFSMRELVARTRALLRRAERYGPADSAPTDTGPAESASEVQMLGDLHIDHSGRRVVVEGESVHLTRTEFDLLVSLARHPGAVLSRGQLLETVWQWPGAGETRTVDSHVRSLRRKVGHGRIRTVHGVGYALASEPS